MHPQPVNASRLPQAQGNLGSYQNQRPRSAPPSYANQNMSSDVPQTVNSPRLGNAPNPNNTRSLNPPNQQINNQPYNFTNQSNFNSVNQSKPLQMQNQPPQTLSSFPQPGQGRGSNFGNNVHKQTQVIIGNQKSNAPQALKPMSFASPFNNQNVPPKNGQVTAMGAPHPPINQDQFPSNPPIPQNPVMNRSAPVSVVNEQGKQNIPNVSVNNNVPVQAPPAVRQVQNPPSKQVQVTPNSVQPPNSNTFQNFPLTKNNGVPVVAPNSPGVMNKSVPQKATVPPAAKVAVNPPKPNVVVTPAAPSSDIDEISSQYDEPGEAQFWIEAVNLIPDANNDFDKNKTTNKPNSTQVPVTQSQDVTVANLRLQEMSYQNEALRNRVQVILEDQTKKQAEFLALQSKLAKMEEDNNRLREQMAQLNTKKQRISTITAEEAYVNTLVKENESLKSKLAFQEQETKRIHDEMLVLAMDKTMAQKVENKPPPKQNQASESNANGNPLAVDETSEKQRPVKKQKTGDTNATASANSNPSSNLLEMLPLLNVDKKPHVIQKLVSNPNAGIFKLLRCSKSNILSDPTAPSELASQISSFVEKLNSNFSKILYGEAPPFILYPALQPFVNKQFEYSIIESALDVINILTQSSEECRKRLFACSCTHCNSSTKTTQSPLHHNVASPRAGVNPRIIFSNDVNINLPSKLQINTITIVASNPEEQNALLDYLLNVASEFSDAENLISKLLSIFYSVAAGEPEYHMERFEPLFALKFINKLITFKFLVPLKGQITNEERQKVLEQLSLKEQVIDLLTELLRNKRMVKLAAQRHESEATAIIDQVGRFLDWQIKWLSYSEVRPLRGKIVKLLQLITSYHIDDAKALACAEDVCMRLTWFLRDEVIFLEECEVKKPNEPFDYSMIREGLELLVTIFSQSPDPLLDRQPFIYVVSRLENQNVPQNVRTLVSTASDLENDQYDASQHPSVLGYPPPV